MSNEPNEPQLGMPVAEVIAYLSEIAAHNAMISERIIAQVNSLGEALNAAAEAQDLADLSSDNAS